MSHYRLLTLIAIVFLVAHLAGARQADVPADTSAFTDIFLAYYDILHSASSVQSFNLSAQDYSIKLSIPLAGGLISGTLRRTTLDFNSSGSKTPLDITLVGKLQSLAVAYQASLGDIGVEGRGMLADEHGRLSFYGGAAATLRFPLTILEEIRLGISEESVPFDFRTAYLDSELPLAQSWRQTVVESAVALTPIRDNRVVIQYRFSGSAPATEHSPFLSRDNTETHTWHGIITHSFKKMELSVSYERVTAQSSTDFLHDATTFGEFNLSGVKSEEAMLRCSFPSSVDEDGSAIHGGYRILDGTLVGDLQSWPFFSVLQSVITNRIYYRLGGSVEYWQAGITHTWRIAPFSVRPAVTYYDVKPNLGIQTWQPLFLTVGVSSFADNQLDVAHAGLAQLEVAVRTELAGISAELYATQFLPLFQTRRAVQGGTGGAPSAPVAEGPATTTGGRWVTLTVRTQL